MSLRSSPRIDSTGIVADGALRQLKAIEAEVRPAIEEKYAEEWNRSGLLTRWFLLKEIEREFAKAVAEKSKDISPYSLY